MANWKSVLFKWLRARRRGLLIAGVIAPMTSWASTWSSCQTITSLTDYTAYNSSFYLNLSPGIAGCSADTSGGALYRVGIAGVTADSYKSLVASTMAAFLTGRQVMLYYDSSQPPACFVSIVSLGGYANQCN